VTLHQKVQHTWQHNLTPHHILFLFSLWMMMLSRTRVKIYFFRLGIKLIVFFLPMFTFFLIFYCVCVWCFWPLVLGYAPSVFKLLSPLILSHVWPPLFKILVQKCKIISHDSIFFSDKMNPNKIYDNFYFWVRRMVKRKKSMTTII
jgi:hypothetical protein